MNILIEINTSLIKVLSMPSFQFCLSNKIKMKIFKFLINSFILMKVMYRSKREITVISY